MGARNLAKKSRNPLTFRADVATSVLNPSDGFVLVIEFLDTVNPVSWFAKHKSLIAEHLTEHGVILFRNSGLAKNRLAKAVSQLVPASSIMANYTGGVAPRKSVAKDVFLATEEHHSVAILQHHEMSYLAKHPSKLFFYSQIPALHGGATPVAFSRKVKSDLDKSLFAELETRGICYVRNYIDEIEANQQRNSLVGWRRSFNATTRAEAEDKLKALGFEFEWVNDGHLRTFNSRPAVKQHPLTGETFPFNHSTLLHTVAKTDWVSPVLRRGVSYDPRMLDLPLEYMPYACLWGDDRKLMPDMVIEELFQVYNRNKFSFQWRQGDLMMVDNFLASHGRDQFVGDRETLVVMSNY